MPLQIDQPQLLQVPVIASPFRGTERTLAASTQMTDKTVHYIPVHFTHRLAWIAETKVVGPSTLLPIDGLDQSRYRHEALTPADRFPKLVPVRLHRLARGNYIQIPVTATSKISVIPERVPQKLHAGSGLSKVDDLRLGPIQLKTQPGFDLGLDKTGQPAALVMRQNHKVIRITHDLGIGPGSSMRLPERALPFHPGVPCGCFRSLLHRRWQASPSLAGWPHPSV